MTILLIDSETYPIVPGLQAPPPVCGQLSTGEILVRDEYLNRVSSHLASGGRIGGYHVAYDLACACAARPSLLPVVMRAYEEDRIECLLVREKLIDIALGVAIGRSYALLDVLRRAKIQTSLRADDKSSDAWRVHYHELDGIPIEDWPEDAIRYAREDAMVLDPLYRNQEARDRGRGFLVDQHRQSRASWVLQLVGCWGIRVDLDYVREYRRQIEEEAESLRSILIEAGIVRPDGTRNMCAARDRMVLAMRYRSLPVPITKTGRDRDATEQEAIENGWVALDADACAGSGDDVLRAFARFGSLKAMRARGWRMLQAAERSMPIQARFDVLKETGRTSCSKGKIKPGKQVLAWGDQIQNMDRQAGPRECYVPRRGHLWLSVDYSAAELHTLAQVCVWMGLDSRLAQVLRSGKDAHLAFGAEMRGWSYEWAKDALQGTHGKAARTAAKEARQMAKAANFGFPGGLGVSTFRRWAAVVYGLDLSEMQARELKDHWLAMYPEMRQYFSIINGLIESGEPLVHLRSNRVRGRVTYTSACNSYFQGLAADMAKASGWYLARACYVDHGPLLGSRIVNFVHDEWILEVPEDTAHECAEDVVKIMERAGEEWCPDVPVRAEPALSRRWRKGADPVYLDGRLIPWEDRPGAQPSSTIAESWDRGTECCR